MSLRCSLLGHSYGEAEIEREREEQGSEVVVTVREFEECERCGDRKVVTENKEVTALQSPAPDLESAESDAAADQSSDSTANNAPGASGGSNASDGRTAGGPAAGTGRSPTAPSSPTSQSDVQMGADADVAGDDAEIIDDSPSSSDSAGSAEQSGRSEASEANTSSGESGASGGSDTASTAEGDFEQAQSAADDDGVILDDDEESSASDDGRTPGEWPDADTTHPAETDGSPREWPSVGREDDDEGFDAGPADSERADVDFGGGLTPESAPEVDDDESEEVEFVNAEGDALRSQDTGASDADFSSGISAGADAPSLSGPSKDPGVDAEFVCPECDYREAVSGSSLRAGDICPDCSRGYIAQE